jgi:hypothetical protein
MAPVIRDWHKPSNDECEQNKDAEANCTCKLTIPSNGKKHKPRVIFRVTDHSVMRGVKPDLVVELHDDGKLIVRESKRRARYETTIGSVYCRLVKNHALQAAAEKARTRAANRKQAKASKRIAQRLARKGKR